MYSLIIQYFAGLYALSEISQGQIVDFGLYVILDRGYEPNTRSIRAYSPK